MQKKKKKAQTKPDFHYCLLCSKTSRTLTCKQLYIITPHREHYCCGPSALQTEEFSWCSNTLRIKILFFSAAFCYSLLFSALTDCFCLVLLFFVLSIQLQSVQFDLLLLVKYTQLQLVVVTMSAFICAVYRKPASREFKSHIKLRCKSFQQHGENLSKPCIFCNYTEVKENTFSPHIQKYMNCLGIMHIQQL